MLKMMDFAGPDAPVRGGTDRAGVLRQRGRRCSHRIDSPGENADSFMEMFGFCIEMFGFCSTNVRCLY